MNRFGRCAAFAVSWGLLWATAYPAEVDAATITIDTTIVASDVADLPVGVPVFWTLTFDGSGADEDPSPDAYLLTDFAPESARAERPPYPGEVATLAANGFLTGISASTATDTWQAVGNLDLIGLLPFEITLTGIGVSVDAALPEFQTFTGGLVELDLSPIEIYAGGTFATMQVDAIHVPEASSGLLFALACAGAVRPSRRPLRAVSDSGASRRR